MFIKKLHCSGYKRLPEPLRRASRHYKPVAEINVQLTKNTAHWLILILLDVLELPTPSLFQDHMK